MSESLDVEGFGATREEAHAYADRLATTYFGPGVTVERVVRRAELQGRNMEGQATAWSVNIEYHLNDEPTQHRT